MTTEATQPIAPGAHPQVSETLQHLQQFTSLLSDQMHQITEASYKGTDEDNTVEVTVDGNRWLTQLFIEDGLLRLGAETVGERVNEALRNAQAAATGALEAQQAELITSIATVANTLLNGLESK